MRNLKRALALALSSVMLMGMMVIGTSAKGFDDVTAAHDAEAIEVMQAIEVMVGDDAGNFNPDQKVTRAEAAVVIAKLLDLSVEDFDGADLAFTDVPAWAAPFVAAVNAEGIMVGYNDTTFGSNDTIKAVDFALMVMKVLGYFQFESDYGTDYVMATAAQAGKIDLFDDVKASVKTPLTREQVARITLNALETETVEVSGGSITVEGKDFSVTTTHNYYEGELLMNALFDNDLRKVGAVDKMGRPATKWIYEGTIGTYADKADVVVVADDNFTTRGAVEAYQKLVDEDYETADGIEYVYVNGSDTNTVGANIAKGDKIEFFMNKDSSIDTAVVTRYSVAKIDEIDTEVTKDDKADDITCYVTLEGVVTRFDDVDVAGFDAATYVEDAYILYAVNAEDASEIIASEIPATVKGEVEATKGAKVKIAGEYYAVNGVALAIEDKGTFFQDLAGQIVAFEGETAKSENYAYVYATDSEPSGDLLTTTETAYVVLADGTYANYEIDEDSDAISAGAVIAYTIKDGKISKATPADTLYAAGAQTIDKAHATIGAYKTTADTEFVFWNIVDSKMKTDTATGFKNVDVAGASTVIVYDADTDKVLYAFVNATNGTAASDIVYGVVCENTVVTTKVDDDYFYTYTVVVDGEEIEITSETQLTLAEDSLISYKLDKDGYAINVTNDDTTYAVQAVVAGEYVKIAGVEYDLEEVDTYTVVKEFDRYGDVDDIYVKSGADLEKDDQVFYAYDADGLLILVEYKEIH